MQWEDAIPQWRPWLTDSLTRWGSHRETEMMCLTLMSRLQCKQPISDTSFSSSQQQEGGGGGWGRQTRPCKGEGVHGLTVKPMPTVAVKDPGRNLPWSYWTSREVLPTPLSPNKIVCRERWHHELPEARAPCGHPVQVTVRCDLTAAGRRDVWNGFTASHMAAQLLFLCLSFTRLQLSTSGAERIVAP